MFDDNKDYNLEEIIENVKENMEVVSGFVHEFITDDGVMEEEPTVERVYEALKAAVAADSFCTLAIRHEAEFRTNFDMVRSKLGRTSETENDDAELIEAIFRFIKSSEDYASYMSRKLTTYLAINQIPLPF